MPTTDPEEITMPNVTFTWNKPLSVGHLMSTTGTLRATTRTRSVVKLGGFHGAVTALVFDEQDKLIARGETHTYGVDGVWIGQSDRTDAWTETFGPSVGAAAHKVTITHSWDPQWLDGIKKTVIIIGVILEVALGALASGGLTGVFTHSSMNEFAPEHNGHGNPMEHPLAVEGDGLEIDAPLALV